MIHSEILDTFTPTCSYRVINGNPCDEEILDEELWNSSEVVFLRTWDGEIVYVGKSDRPLRYRMREHFGYIRKPKNPREAAYRDWAEGKTVIVYTHQPERTEYMGPSIPPHLGLKAALIGKVQPKFGARH